jgi:hypothetical protein
MHLVKTKYIQKMLITLYTLFQNGAREHESEANGARFREIIIDYTTREKF